MIKNKKTVRRCFSYLQCDDFAAYLSQMAAQGWHFKEWGAGLVFEKGEPKDAVYAVEVFIDGSSYDLRPGDHTLNFADYCEAAGWQLIDAKQKFCIFKQVKTDAVPIVTPEERLRNASKAYRGQLIWQAVAAVMWIGNMLLRFIPDSSRINALFSNFDLFFAAFWCYYFIETAAKWGRYLLWLRNAKKRLACGESELLHQKKEALWNWINIGILIALEIGLIAVGGPVHLVTCLVTLAILLILALLLAKFRPDRETNISIQIVLPIVLIFTIILGSLISVSVDDAKEPAVDTFPFEYADIGIEAGAVKASDLGSSRSIFGTKDYYSLGYADGALTYVLYQTEQDWILDMVWDYERSYKWYTNATDCAALWNAEMAQRSSTGCYIVRFSEAILVLYTFDDTELSQEHTAIICDALGLE